MRLTLARVAGLVLAGLLLIVPGLALAAGPTFPPLTGRVVDRANLLSPQTEGDISARLEALERRNGTQLVVVTLDTLQGYEIEEYGYQLGRAWGLGDARRDDGVLFIVAPTEKKVRIEVGYGLEPVLTDGMSGLILQQSVLPHFRATEYRDGVLAGVEALDRQLSLDRGEAEARAATARPQASRGGSSGVAAGVFMVIIFIFFSLIRAAGFRGRRRRRGLGGLGPVLLWTAAEAARSRGGWHDGGGGGFGGGGGGSFGGGGASGGW